MAHFAQIDKNIVLRVVVVDNNNAQTEEHGVLFLKNLYGENTEWKQTSYNGNIRKNYAGVGYTYNESIDAFVAPKPYTSWVLDEENGVYTAPTPMPTDADQEAGEYYRWDEETTAWVKETREV